jgi:hypothetical protein
LVILSIALMVGVMGTSNPSLQVANVEIRVR